MPSETLQLNIINSLDFLAIPKEHADAPSFSKLRSEGTDYVAQDTDVTKTVRGCPKIIGNLNLNGLV